VAGRGLWIHAIAGTTGSVYQEGARASACSPNDEMHRDDALNL